MGQRALKQKQKLLLSSYIYFLDKYIFYRYVEALTSVLTLKGDSISTLLVNLSSGKLFSVYFGLQGLMV